MRQQHEITTSAPLLGKDGDLLEPGWARSLLPVYRRADIKASPMRIKEWDYYLITDGHIGLALTIADNGYMGLDSISFLHFDEGWEQTTSRMRALPLGKTHLPESSAEGASEVARGGYAMTFYHEDGLRKLSFHMDKFRGKDAIEGIVQLSDEPIESMVIATPFDKPGHFYYNQKINCMRAEGWIELGDRRFELTKDKFFAVLDWGRGVWTYHNTWYWGSASGELDGVPFGWNIGYGFGNTEAATENVLFYDGRIHKLSEVRFEALGLHQRRQPVLHELHPRARPQRVHERGRSALRPASGLRPLYGPHHARRRDGPARARLLRLRREGRKQVVRRC